MKLLIELFLSESIMGVPSRALGNSLVYFDIVIGLTMWKIVITRAVQLHKRPCFLMLYYVT